MKQQYNVGLKTLTDVYTAKASYDSAVATHIGAQTTLANDRENLRVITGVYYTHLSILSDDFPLISPEPADVNEWVKIALIQNWSIKSSQYSASSAREVIKQQMAGNLPTLNLQAAASRQYVDSINKYNTFSERNGPGSTSERSLTLNLNVPIFEGGGVVAQTNKAKYDYQVAQQQLEQTIRNTVNTTRQSYNSLVAGISQINADKQAIKSSISSLQGLEASYRVGAETLVDVLNQQQNVLKAQTQYATDRYAFVNNILALKQAAGTLSFDDLRAINAWLVDKQRQTEKKYPKRKEMKKENVHENLENSH
jgi:outer membrane protein